MDHITTYFPDLTAKQREQYAALAALYGEWNAKINVISRKDIGELYLHHVLHSLAISRFVQFRPGTRVLDFGCGGGFPGIPLAIMFPEAHFRLIDGTGKKVMVAQEVAKAIGLTNCEAIHARGEEEKGKYQFIVSRAVMPLGDMVKIVRKNIAREQTCALPNGIICLKGKGIDEELRPFKKIVGTEPISQWFAEPWFESKQIVYLPI